MTSQEPGNVDGASRRRQPSQRLNVNISASTMSTLTELAELNGISMTEAIRRAIQLWKLIDQETHQGREVQVVDPDSSQVQTLRFI
jgi:Ribbon-helix-helix protein, copG family